MNPNSLFFVDATILTSLVILIITVLLWRILNQKCLKLHIIQSIAVARHSESILAIPLIVIEEPERSTSRKYKPPNEPSGWINEQYGQLNQEIAHRLLKVYPNLTWLVLILDYNSSPLMSQVICLLHNWRNKLTGLSFECEEFPENTHGHLRTLISVINRMTVLKSLTLNVHSKFFPHHTNKQIDLEVVTRLSEFNFSSEDGIDIIMNSLFRYATDNNKLWHIGLGNVINEQWWEQFISMRLDFAFRFTHLKVRYPTVNPDKLRIFCSKFGSLVALSLQMGQLSLHRLVACLAPLTKLVHLELDIDFRGRMSFIEDDEKDTNTFSQLASVKVVTLLLATTTHNNLKSSHLDWIFPSVEMLRIWQRHQLCTICSWEVLLAGGTVVPTSSSQHCKRTLLQPWKQCSSLQCILTDIFENQQEWPLHQL